MTELEKALDALTFLDSECSYSEWIEIGMSAKAAGLSFENFHHWSKSAANYSGEKDCLTAWNSFDNSGRITSATLFYKARKKGWKISKNYTKHHSEKTNSKIRGNYKNELDENENLRALDIWKKCIPALPTHEYIIRKQGKPDGLRYYPYSAPSLIINDTDVANYLVVPCFENEKIQTLQFIPPKEYELKLNLSGASFNDGYFIVGDISDRIYICEGIGHAWAINESLGTAAVVCFSAGRIKRVSQIIKAKYPNASIIIIADRGKEKQASEIAKIIDGQWIRLPDNKPENYDVNDYLLHHGKNALCDLLNHPIVEMPLDVIYAHELPDQFTSPDELVEGILIAGDGSILYGDSNCGKTFFVIDMACAIARGENWRGRRTEPGLVIYLAAESPASVQRRLQAYQKHHNVRVKNFVIVKNPINLFDGEADTNAIIQLAHLLEKQCGQKIQLIIGDTLARLSAGANENAGQDMGLVVHHIDRIRAECNAHFMLIHHSGKNAAAGARGWSGVRAAVDTEIEVTDSPAGKCAEITKQRDLGTKGIRIGFRLDTVVLGLTKWKQPATSCVVVSTDAPQKSTSKRMSDVGVAIYKYLNSADIAIKKTVVVKHFRGICSSTAIYRQIKKLVKSGAVSDCMGLVKVVPISANQ